jgi:hypothetical protein
MKACEFVKEKRNGWFDTRFCELIFSEFSTSFGPRREHAEVGSQITPLKSKELRMVLSEFLRVIWMKAQFYEGEGTAGPGGSPDRRRNYFPRKGAELAEYGRTLSSIQSP